MIKVLTSFLIMVMINSCIDRPSNYSDISFKYHEELVSASTYRYNVSMKGKVDGEMTRDPVGYRPFD